MEAVETITREELKEKMDRGDEFVLVETMPEAAYRRQHLLGAVNLNDVGEIPSLLPDKEAEIITYCSNFNRHASEKAARELATRGYENVREYAGGKKDWTGAGLPTESGG